MRTEIIARPGFAALHASLDTGESIMAEPGAMMAHRNTKMSTGAARGGILSGFKRLLASESFFLNKFTGINDDGEIYLTPSVPGDIQDYQMEPDTEIVLQSGAFLACSEQVTVDTKFQGIRGLFNREGLFFLRAYTETNSGNVFFNTYGALVEIDVREDAPFYVDNGHLVAFAGNVDYTLDRVRGLMPLIAGGEGIVLRFEGRGKVWVQTRELQTFAGVLAPYLPAPPSSSQ